MKKKIALFIALSTTSICAIGPDLRWLNILQNEERKFIELYDSHVDRILHNAPKARGLINNFNSLCKADKIALFKRLQTLQRNWQNKQTYGAIALMLIAAVGIFFFHEFIIIPLQ